MSTTELLDRATAAGIAFCLAGDQITLSAPRRPPDSLLAELHQNKPELLAVLRTRLESKPRRHTYRFRLHNSEGGGTYITSGDLAAARAELLKRYGQRLALVVTA